MSGAFQIASILVSVVLILLIMLQVKGGALGSLLGGDAGGGIARTRRGLEKTIFQITVFLCIAFMAISLFLSLGFLAKAPSTNIVAMAQLGSFSLGLPSSHFASSSVSNVFQFNSGNLF